MIVIDVIVGSIMACMVIRAVVKANSQSNRKQQILTPYGSKTPEQILMKPKIYNYVVDMTTYANPCGDATTWVVSAKTWHHMFWFLSRPFIFVGLAHTDSPILTIYTPHDVLQHKDVPFEGLIVANPHLWVKIPPKNLHFRGVNGRFQPKRAKY